MEREFQAEGNGVNKSRRQESPGHIQEAGSV